MRHSWLSLSTRWIPSVCSVCHAWPSQPVCEACVTRFAQPRPRCKRCALPVPQGIALCGDCLVNPPPLDACFAAVAYGYPWSDLVARFKFRDHPSQAKPLALLMRSVPFIEPALEQAQVIVPMPLSPQRLRERGYNQAWELARWLAPSVPNSQKLNPHLLLRITDTPPQAGLNREARLRNLRTAFAVDPLRVAQLQGQHVVLVDDVMTSGASLHAAALTLRAAGATHITGLVFARTEPQA